MSARLERRMAALVPSAKFISTGTVLRVPGLQFGTLEYPKTKKVKRVMDNDAVRFRQYSAECRRLAQQASEKDKAILMEIAAAWIACADEEERKAQFATKNK
jgi:hypothetical protein